MNNTYQSGWRPAYGWAGLAIIVLHFILFPIIVLVASIFKINLTTSIDVPAISALLTTVIAIAGMRSYDKLKGIDTKDDNEV